MILLIIIFILFGTYYIHENLVAFKDYKVPNFGYCKAPINESQFKEGKYDTYCWNQMGYEDCEMLNSQGYNCGKNLETGETLPCVYKYGKCKDDPQCFSSCYDQVGACKGPYMIPVKSNNLIGFGPAN